MLAAVGRGEAKRIADRNPGILAIVVGSSGPRKDGSPDAMPIERVGDTLIVELGHGADVSRGSDFFRCVMGRPNFKMRRAKRTRRKPTIFTAKNRRCVGPSPILNATKK